MLQCLSIIFTKITNHFRVVYADGVRLCLWTAATNRPILHLPDGNILIWRTTMEWEWQGKTQEIREKPVPVPLCPPPTQNDQEANPGLRHERPATNRLSLIKNYAFKIIKLYVIWSKYFWGISNGIWPYWRTTSGDEKRTCTPTPAQTACIWWTHEACGSHAGSKVNSLSSTTALLQ
jgi:hypothetical protein